MRKALVTGGGGFIGSWLVKRLKQEDYWVRGVDIKWPEFDETAADDFQILDLRGPWECREALKGGIDDVYQLAANMGGIGWITSHVAEIARDNTLININMLDASVKAGVERYLYTSSACVYNQEYQQDEQAEPLREEQAWPALPERGYGLEKLYAEEMTNYYHQDYDLDTRIVRFHNVGGPLGTWDGGREKSPAALCRKIARAVRDGYDEIEIWGDGAQTRTYMSVHDCVEGLRRIMESGYRQPLNLGTDELVTIDQLAYIIADIANKQIKIKHIDGPQGVRGRSSDNSLGRQVLGWEPKTPLREWLVPTYEWIAEQVAEEPR